MLDPVTRETKGLSEVERHQEHLDKMREEAEALRPLYAVTNGLLLLW